MKRNAGDEEVYVPLVPFEGMTLERDEEGWIYESVLVDGVIYHIEDGSFPNPEDNGKIEWTHQAVVEGVADNTIESLTIPETVECGGMSFPVRVIGMLAFKACMKLRRITFPESLRVICPLAFDQCYKLDNVVLPDKFLRIDFGAFLDCHGLKHISVKDASQVLINERAFNGCNMQQLKIVSRDEE